jgi:uncharacterized pyridoxamine 5'-phosphate oxidase family protein
LSAKLPANAAVARAAIDIPAVTIFFIVFSFGFVFYRLNYNLKKCFKSAKKENFINFCYNSEKTEKGK